MQKTKEFLHIPNGTEQAFLCTTSQNPSLNKWMPSAGFFKLSKYLRAIVTDNFWSYIVNIKTGNAMSFTLLGYGSCTPVHILQRWIDEMSVKKQKELEKECDKTQSKII